MFGFIKRKQKTPETATPSAEPQSPAEKNVADLSHSLEKTKRTFSDGMADFLLGKKSIDDELLDTLETRLLSADVGVDAPKHREPASRRGGHLRSWDGSFSK